MTIDYITYQKEQLAFRRLYLGEDGTFTYDSGFDESNGMVLGNYYISGNKIILHCLFSETVKDNLYISNGNYELEILSTNQLKSNLGFTGIPTVTMTKTDTFDEKIKQQYWEKITNDKIWDYTSGVYIEGQ